MEHEDAQVQLRVRIHSRYLLCWSGAQHLRMCSPPPTGPSGEFVLLLVEVLSAHACPAHLLLLGCWRCLLARPLGGGC